MVVLEDRAPEQLPNSLLQVTSSVPGGAFLPSLRAQAWGSQLCSGPVHGLPQPPGFGPVSHRPGSNRAEGASFHWIG
jgi:hypothetical protein